MSLVLLSFHTLSKNFVQARLKAFTLSKFKDDDYCAS